jgi:hypothetical protein
MSTHLIKWLKANNSNCKIITLILVFTVFTSSSWFICLATENVTDVEILNHNSYFLYESYLETPSQKRCRGEFFHVVGEIRNIGDQNIQIDKVNVTYYDSEGLVVSGPKTYAVWIDTLIPGMKVPFAAILLDEDASERIVDYEISVNYHRTFEEPYKDLLILQHQYYNDSYPIRFGYQRGVIGEMQNLGDDNIEEVSVLATMYDADGSVLGFVSKLVDLSTLVVRQKSPFNLPFTDLYSGHFPSDIVERINSYQLYVYCSYSNKIPYRDFHVKTETVEERWVYSRWEYIVKGEVKNVGDINASVVVVTATFYDDDGKIVDIRFDSFHELGVGESSLFEVKVVSDLELAFSGYDIQVDCWQYREKSAVNLSCLVMPESIKYGEEIEVTGTISPSKDTQKVTMNFIRPKRDIVKKTTTTETNGSYHLTYKPDAVGFWKVFTSYLGDAEHSRAESDETRFKVEKKSSSLEVNFEKEKIKIGESVTIHGLLDPPLSGVTINLNITKPDKTKITDSVKTQTDGSFTYILKPDDVGNWWIDTRWFGNSTHEDDFNIDLVTVTESGACFIASATYGSKLSPEVRFLRSLRNKMATKSFTGSHFIKAFNSFYYSFSPQIASLIIEHQAIREFMKYFLTPFLWIMRISALVFESFTIHSEIQPILSLLLASSLIGVTYLTIPLTALFYAVKHINIKKRHLRVLLIIWLINLSNLFIANIIKSPLLLIFATSSLVILTLIFSVALCSRYLTFILNKAFHYHTLDKN